MIGLDIGPSQALRRSMANVQLDDPFQASLKSFFHPLDADIPIEMVI